MVITYIGFGGKRTMCLPNNGRQSFSKLIIELQTHLDFMVLKNGVHCAYNTESLLFYSFIHTFQSECFCCAVTSAHE